MSYALQQADPCKVYPFTRQYIGRKTKNIFFNLLSFSLIKQQQYKICHYKAFQIWGILQKMWHNFWQTPPSLRRTCVQDQRDRQDDREQNEFLVITRITHVMDKRSYFSQSFHNQVNSSGVNLDNPKNWKSFQTRFVLQQHHDHLHCL